VKVGVHFLKLHYIYELSLYSLCYLSSVLFLYYLIKSNAYLNLIYLSLYISALINSLKSTHKLVITVDKTPTVARIASATSYRLRILSFGYILVVSTRRCSRVLNIN
jgi:hypothetical protein